jgi:hypothetical protein
MLALAVAFVLGNLCGLLCPAMLPDAWSVAALAVAAIAVPWRRTRLLAFALAGFGLALMTLAGHRAGLQVDEERVLAEAEVASLPQVTGTAVHFDAWLRVPREPSLGTRYVRIAWSGAAGRGLHTGNAGSCCFACVRRRAPATRALSIPRAMPCATTCRPSAA